MKTSLRTVSDGGDTYQALMFVCPGCAVPDGPTGLHMLPVNSPHHAPSWTFDGNVEAPTLEPSILTQSQNADGPTRCHSYLRGGVFQFLEDCTHPLAGQFVPLPDLPEWVDSD